MAHPESSGLIRWSTELDPNGPHSSRITPLRLGRETFLITPNWLWSPEPLKGSFGHLEFGSGKIASKARRKVRDLVTGLDLAAEPDRVAHESVLYELRFRANGTVYVQGAHAGFTLGNAFEHVLIRGEPGEVLADRPERISVVLGGCNGSSQATISTRLGAAGPHSSSARTAARRTCPSSSCRPSSSRKSFYEENLARLTTTFAGNTMRHTPESTQFSFVNDVPWRAYWLYMLRTVQQEKTSASAYRRRRGEVNRRFRMGRDRNVELLREVLGDRSAGVEFIDRDELQPLDEILENLQPGRRAPELQDLVDIMRNSGDQLWNLTLDPDLRTKVTFMGKPLTPEVRTVQELCGNSYVVAVLGQMLAGPVMSVNVEQTIEHFVREWTKVLTKHAGVTFRGKSFAVYPFSHFVPSETGAVMYRTDPGRVVTVNDPTGISGFLHGEWVDPVDLLPGSYRW